MKSVSCRNVTLSICIIGAAVLLTTFIINLFNRQDALRPIMEIGVFYSLLVFVVSSPPANRFLSNLPKPHWVIFLILCFCFTFAQYINREKTTFPFVVWNMFSNPKVNHQFRTFQMMGVDQDGREFKMDVTDYFPSQRHSRVEGGINRRLVNIIYQGGHPLINTAHHNRQPSTRILTKKWERPLRKKFPGISKAIQAVFSRDYPVKTIAQLEEEVRVYVTAVGKAHNDLMPHQPIEKIKIYLCASKPGEYFIREDRCTADWEYDI